MCCTLYFILVTTKSFDLPIIYLFESPSQFGWLEPESEYFSGLKSSPLLPIPGLSSTRTTFFNLSNFSRMKYLSFLCAKERVFISILQYIHFLSLIWLLFSGYLWKCRNIGLTSLPTLIFDMLNKLHWQNQDSNKILILYHVDPKRIVSMKKCMLCNNLFSGVTFEILITRGSI